MKNVVFPDVQLKFSSKGNGEKIERKHPFLKQRRTEMQHSYLSVLFRFFIRLAEDLHRNILLLFSSLFASIFLTEIWKTIYIIF